MSRKARLLHRSLDNTDMLGADYVAPPMMRRESSLGGLNAAMQTLGHPKAPSPSDDDLFDGVPGVEAEANTEDEIQKMAAAFAGKLSFSFLDPFLISYLLV